MGLQDGPNTTGEGESMAGRDERQEQDVAQSNDGDMCEAEIDYNLMETFPASDAPSWTLGIGEHRKQQDHFDENMASVNEASHQNETDEPA